MTTLRFRVWRLLAFGIAIVVLATFVILVWPQKPLAVSPDGRVRFLKVIASSGKKFNAEFGNKWEAKIRDWLFDAGLRKVKRTSFRMTSPAGTHFLVLQYAGDIGVVKENYVTAKLVARDGEEFPLIPVGGGKYGIQNRQFAYWVINGLTNVKPNECRLKVYLPPESPTMLPIQ